MFAIDEIVILFYSNIIVYSTMLWYGMNMVIAARYQRAFVGQFMVDIMHMKYWLVRFFECLDEDAHIIILHFIKIIKPRKRCRTKQNVGQMFDPRHNVFFDRLMSRPLFFFTLYDLFNGETNDFRIVFSIRKGKILQGA